MIRIKRTLTKIANYQTRRDILLPHDAMHKRGLFRHACVSVRLSVTFVLIVYSIKI